IYFISGIAGGLISIYMHPTTVGIGASGAIFGIFGALSGMVIVHRRRMEEQFKAFMKEFGIILFLNLVIGVVFESVDLSAHIAGLIVGMIGGAMVAKSYKMIWIYISIMVISMILFYNYLYSYLLPLYMSLANAQF
ncbi:MAG TPA: rhomboid family intramembrane serine protease, partial [Campylobacterales bacterium]|nr:rhomboid family intramembrane serine protease [Campylobacterales bacterium]